MKTIKVQLGKRAYDIFISKGILSDIDKLFNLKRKVFIVTDSGVPKAYSLAVKERSHDAMIHTIRSGEESKSMVELNNVLEEMSEFGMTRGDAVVAVGGGVVGDLAGFAASVYMRGIDFYNVPTTVLSQVDSSVGGKTAVNLGGIKNIVGSFYQPRGVLIDTDTLATLQKRHISSGLAEAVKMSLTFDSELFSLFENMTYDEILENIDTVIERSLLIKKRVVEEDEYESGLRRILNFGHTYGHAIESEEALTGLYHGECVALGMIPMCHVDVAKRLIPVLKKLSLPTEYKKDVTSLLRLIAHDKKRRGNKITVILSEKIGSFISREMEAEEIASHIDGAKECGWRQ